MDHDIRLSIDFSMLPMKTQANIARDVSSESS